MTSACSFWVKLWSTATDSPSFVLPVTLSAPRIVVLSGTRTVSSGAGAGGAKDGAWPTRRE